MNVRLSNIRPSILVGVLVAGLACSGSPTTPPPPAVPTTTLTSPTTTTTMPVASVSCPKGTVDTHCSRVTPSFLDELDGAIDKLVKDRPELFDVNDLASAGGYRIKDIAAFNDGVIRNLQGQGLCAGFDLKEIQIKRGGDTGSSEQYDSVLASGHIRRGIGSYRATCSPAAFPLDPEDVIAQVRVSFFGIRCNDDRTPPRNGENKLPIGCVGNVTASPKNKDGHDVDPRIHGSSIDWTLEQEGNFVRVDDAPESPFNKNLTGRDKGHFSLCAFVREVKGCLNGEVIQ